ncbi:unnamed protein product [Cladocopium goreaui]|uniref:Uncharacterized protein n=1 Tax=Cladocopium goreaui TaxID=2562237 RepID=A0A9P1GPV8_9DINO|nr:unnamed protein product [Cladocopium goreaui]
MGHYQSSTPKRHWGAGNSTLISRLDKGVLQGWKKKKGGPTPVVKYIDSRGVKRYKGTADLRKTEIYPMAFAREVLDLVEDMKKSCRGQPQLPSRVPPALETFQTTEWNDDPDFTAKVETPTPVATPVRSLAEGSAPQVPEPPRSLTDAVPETPPTPEGGRKPMTDRGSLQLKLRLAAKARIMRMVKAKSKRRDLEVPEWVKAEWGKGNKNQIADLLCSANFDKEAFLNSLHVVVTKKKVVSVEVEEGWFSESELRDEVGWSQLYILRRYAVLLSTSHFRCRKNLYDNEEEYWVVLKETGKRKEEQSFEEIHKRQKQAIPHI